VSSPAAPVALTVAASVSCVRDTCNVYVLRSGRKAVLVDFGSGAVLDHLAELGVDRVTDVLVTHHHRDQVQGLARAVEAGIAIWVPPVEVDLIADVDEHWRARRVENDYDLREDRFSLLGQVPISGTVAEYRTARYGGFEVYTLPTPGHTVGSVTYLVGADGRKIAFSGDLVYGHGKVWSLAATQWSYSGPEGLVASIVSCSELGRREPDLLLPSHGEPVEEPQEALAAVRERLQALVDLRSERAWDVGDVIARPWVAVTPHLWRSRSSFANTYALLSETGAALLIDFGYDVATGLVPSTERSARRPLLWTLDALRRDHGVDRVEVVLPTHYHDDHVAGIPLLRDVEGAEVWASENVAPILADPGRFDLPCLWFDPIPVDRVLTLGEPVRWHEYELTAYELPGHTLYAAAFLFEVDGKRVLAIGDQHGSFDPERPDLLNYQYRNRFRVDDYVRSAELYRALEPDLIVSGHWRVREATGAYLDRLLDDGRRLAELHRELLPDEGLGPEGFLARIEPYRSRTRSSEEIELEVIVRNPFARPEEATVRLVVPPGWEGAEARAGLEPAAEARIRMRIRTGGRERRARIAADVVVGETPFGQQAEALVDVE
jgi:glyoxylase-like metal-dependent hydrolase (beta-lactamase superfamily II)